MVCMESRLLMARAKEMPGILSGLRKKSSQRRWRDTARPALRPGTSYSPVCYCAAGDCFPTCLSSTKNFPYQKYKRTRSDQFWRSILSGNLLSALYCGNRWFPPFPLPVPAADQSLTDRYRNMYWYFRLYFSTNVFTLVRFVMAASWVFSYKIRLL